LEHKPEILSPSEGRTGDQPAFSALQCLPSAELPGLLDLWPIQLFFWKLPGEGKTICSLMVLLCCFPLMGIDSELRGKLEGNNLRNPSFP